MHRRGPKTWTSPEEEDFLMGRLPEYVKCQLTRVYEKFWADTFCVFLEKWPERARQRTGTNVSYIPAEGDLTGAQREALGIILLNRKKVSNTDKPKINDY